jgi:hypothetical protein
LNIQSIQYKMQSQLEDAELDDLISTETVTGSNDNANDIAKDNAKKLSSYYQYQYQFQHQHSNSQSQSQSQSPNWPSMISKVPTLLFYICMSFLLQFPRTSKFITAVALASILFLLISLTNQGKTVEIGKIGYDFASIHSQYDFDIGKVDHWCIDVS